MAKKSKAKGGRGEARVRNYLEAKGWTIADKETSGLAGDDIFAEDPSGVWHSIEVKHVRCLTPDHYKQAKRQSQEREEAIKAQLANPRSMASRLGITYDKKDWLLIWVPSGYDNATDYIVFRQSGRTTRCDTWS